MDAVALVRLALSVITERLIAILSLTMACGLSCWVMWGPEWERVATLGIFVLFSYLLVRNKESRRERPENIRTEE
jgi:hypothetical protein